jgi:dTDP-glucose 4,6-dehydratase
MKILVIGSNSFSGSNLINLLLNEGYEVFGISRSNEYPSIFLPYKNNTNLKNFKFYKFNLNFDNIKIASLIKKEKIQNIFNFAAQGEVRSSFYFPLDHYQTNLMAHVNFLEKIKKFDFIENYIQISTPEVYGTNKELVFESFNLNPSSPYASSKAALDLYLLTLHKTFEFPVKFIRSSNVYGPCQQLYRIIPKSFILFNQNKKINLDGGGKAKKIYTFIDDISEGEMLVMKKGKIGEIYHLSSNELISIKNVVQKIAKYSNKNFSNCVKISKERIGQDRYYNISSKKINNELKWKAETDFDLGLMMTYKWIQDNFDYLKKRKLFYQHQK